MRFLRPVISWVISWVVSWVAISSVASFWVVGVALLAGCDPPADAASTGLAEPVAGQAARDFELEVCRARIAEVSARPPLPGIPAYDQRRPEILGRAVGEPMWFVAPPPEPEEPAAKNETPVARLRRMLRMHDKAKIRPRVLRGGYAFSSDIDEAFALVQDVGLEDIFEEKEIFLMRGEAVQRLERAPARYERGHEYRFAEGTDKGRTATLLFGDRISAVRSDLDKPLHRDLRSLRHRVGFDRIHIDRATEDALLAKLRFGARWVGALLTTEGARIELACIDAERPVREEVLAHAQADAPRRRAVAALQEAVGHLVAERLPFDRPREAEDHFSDGQLRPNWDWAYKQGWGSFTQDGEGYPLFDADGRPWPPETCVAMVLDSYERAAGTWYAPLGQPRKRTVGTIDFDALGVLNRSGVLGFEQYAQKKPELFTHRRIPQPERVLFRDRVAFFAYLAAQADLFQPGDIVSIQGPKRDGHIHQHAILVEDTDPITGLPYGLADQMKRPRRRSWEGIMAEAPLRSLLYHIKPTPALLLKLDREAPPNSGTLATASREHTD